MGDRKFSGAKKYFGILELLFNTLPYVFWKSKDGKYQGANQNQASGFGFSSPLEFVGKTIYEILEDKTSAKAIDQVDQEIMEKNKTLIFEEKIVTSQGEKYYHSQKTPIHDADGNVIGLLGFAMDITELKHQEELIKKERDRLIKRATEEEVIKKERDRLIKIAAQVAHDIRSPAASLLMLAKSCKELPEKERVTLREIAMRIQDIANNLLDEYKPQRAQLKSGIEQAEVMLLSMLVFQLATEKRLQYAELPIQLEFELSSQAAFCFIKAREVDIKRALSNLINNAVEAYNNNVIIKIEVKIDVSADQVKLVVVDHGKGMSPHLVDKILARTKVTQGKTSGHGIGLTQVQETVHDNSGKFFIESTEGVGTVVTMLFPRDSVPDWVVDKILLNADDLVIILDDDISIHGAWDVRFKAILKKTPSLKIRHFINGSEVLAFINRMNQLEKEKVFLLTDYELLKQNLTGLGIIAESKVKRAILVTSHYTDLTVRSQAVKAHAKVLPKELASEVKIEIRPIKMDVKENEIVSRISVIIVDDDEAYVDMLISFAFTGKVVMRYHDPSIFLAEISKYPKGIKIFLDNNFNCSDLKGIDIANKLNEMGYMKIYLLSGEVFDHPVPNFLTIINKFDVDKIKKLVISS